jgi:hypothetical protein
VLAHVLESAGLATVGLSLVRRQAEKVAPPRMLHVQFPLGRPLGRPDDAELQHDVLARAFALLERTDVPILEDHPVTIDDSVDEPASCALPPRFDPDLPAEVDEAIGLRAAYDRHLVAHDDRTAVGRVGGADDVADLIRVFLRLRDGESVADVGWDTPTALGASQDVRAYYEEAGTQLADVTGARRLESWFYRRTATGQLLREVVRVQREADADSVLTSYLVPGSQAR